MGHERSRGQFGSALAVCVAGALTSVPLTAEAQGLLADISGGSTGGVDAPLVTTWQQYSYSFTATQANTFITFLFRNAPGTTGLDDISLVHQGSGTNLLSNGNLASAGAPSPSTAITGTLPANWSAVGTSTATLIGTWRGPDDGTVQGDPPFGSHSPDTGVWVDGNVTTHDGITQQVATTPGNYVLTFWLGSDMLPDGDTVDSLIYAGAIPDGYLLFAPTANIDITQPSYLASNLGLTVNPVFQGGTLTMDQTAASYALDFTLDGSGTNTIDQNGNQSTFTGVFSDATAGTPGSIIIANSGAGGSVTFAGVNTYTGTTTINAGATLALAGAGSIATSAGVIDNGALDISGTTSGASITTLSGSGAVALGSMTLTLTAANDTFSGAISGAGGLAITGGSEVLTGISTYSGGTSVTNAKLTVNGDAALGAAPGGLTLNNATLTTTGSFNSTRPVALAGAGVVNTSGNTVGLSGVVSGPGRLTASGGGILTLSGTNTYAGGTTINGGTTLKVASDAALGATGGGITLGDMGSSGTLVALSSFTSGRNILVNAGGGLINANGNVLTLTGAITQIGVLQSTGGAGGRVVFGGPTTVNNLVISGGTSTNSGTVNAAGGVVVSQTGTFDNTGTVNSPSLTVAGELRGTGTINAPTTVSGILAPGNSPGTLTFNAPVTLTPTATAEFDIDGTGTGTGAGNFSRVIVNGPANSFTAAGVLEPLLRGITGSATNTFTPSVGQGFVVLAAQGGVAGSFASLTQPAGLPAGTRFDALYAPNTLTLVVTPRSYGNLALAGLPETVNQAAVGSGLDAIRPAAGIRINSGAAALFYPLYVLPGQAIPGALDQLAPTIYGAGMMAARDTWYQMAESVSDQLVMRRYGTATANTTPGPNGSTIWVNGMGQFSDVYGGGGSPGYRTSVGGAIAGIDIPVAPGAIAGVSVGGGSVQTSSNGSTDDASAVQFTLYGGLQSGMFFVDGQGAFMHMDQDVRRNMGFWSTGARSDGGLNGGGVQVHGGAQLSYGQWQVEPSLGLSAINMASSSLAETTGGSLSESIGTQSITSMESLASIRVGTQFAVTPTIPLRVHALVGWQHEFLDITAHTTASFLSAGGGAFTVNSAPISRDAARLGAGFDVVVSPAISLYGSYQAALGQDSTAQYLTAGLRMAW